MQLNWLILDYLVCIISFFKNYFDFDFDFDFDFFFWFVKEFKLQQKL